MLLALEFEEGTQNLRSRRVGLVRLSHLVSPVSPPGGTQRASAWERAHAWWRGEVSGAFPIGDTPDPGWDSVSSSAFVWWFSNLVSGKCVLRSREGRH